MDVVDFILLFCACVSFGLATFNVAVGRERPINLVALGLLLATLVALLNLLESVN